MGNRQKGKTCHKGSKVVFTMSVDLIIILAIVVIYILLLRNKKAKEARMGQDYDSMMKEGNFRGLKLMFGKQFLIWGILFLFGLTLTVIQLIQGGIKGWTMLIVTGFLGYRTFTLGRAYKSFKDAEKYLSYRMSDEEIENFWKEENDEELVYRLYDYIQKKSYNFLKVENLNEVEKNIMILTDLDGEVNNGGFEQFFFNSRGEYNDSLVKAATAVNASETAGLSAKALDIISRRLLKDQESDLLDKECDTPFYDKSENLTALIAEYARKNKDSLLS